MTDTTIQIDTDQRTALAAGLRAAADFLERHTDLDIWHDARISRHVSDPVEFRQVAQVLNAEVVVSSPGFAHVTKRFGPVVLDAQTDSNALRAVENLVAFWDAYAMLRATPGLSEVEDMARRYALTDEQVRTVLGGVADGPDDDSPAVAA